MLSNVEPMPTPDSTYIAYNQTIKYTYQTIKQSTILIVNILFYTCCATYVYLSLFLLECLCYIDSYYSMLPLVRACGHFLLLLQKCIFILVLLLEEN